MIFYRPLRMTAPPLQERDWQSGMATGRRVKSGKATERTVEKV